MPAMTEVTISERLLVIEAIVVRLEERLFGNGQPGKLTEIEHRLRAIEDLQPREIPRLKESIDKMWRWIGAIEIILMGGVLVTALIFWQAWILGWIRKP
jgi:hypothetical protein